MQKQTDIMITDTSVFFLPVFTRLPLKFGTEVVTSVTCARVRIGVKNRRGDYAQGWGETPLSIQWIWPSRVPYETRHRIVKDLCLKIAESWVHTHIWGHPIEIGHAFQRNFLPKILRDRVSKEELPEPVPWLAALVCTSAFDIALHDAYGQVNKVSTYKTYCPDFMNEDLSNFLEPLTNSKRSFSGLYPCDFLKTPPKQLVAWHLVGGMDKITYNELDGSEPNDQYPVLLTDWIKTDGLKCLKIKLRGNDQDWDYNRIVQVGTVAIENGCIWLSADFNCTVNEPDYVNEILDRLLLEYPRIYGMILYVEQPFPYDLEQNQIDIHSVSARKPVFMDESAHDWTLVRLGRELGWSGVALKTCKTQTGALLTLSWARAHGMTLMVQDLTNPMLAQIPHVQLAAHAGTIMGVETNSMQFYPAASDYEARIHPGLYSRRNGNIDLSTLGSFGFGYRIDEVNRPLPDPVFSSEA